MGCFWCEQVLDHCKKLPDGMDKKVKNWIDSNANGQHLTHTTPSTKKSFTHHGGITGKDSPSILKCSSVNLQIVAEVDQMLVARKTMLESVKSTLKCSSSATTR